MSILRRIVLLTTDFPCLVGSDVNFIAPELPHLRAQFPEIHLLPSKRPIRLAELDEGIKIHTELAGELGFPSKHKALVHATHGVRAANRFPSVNPSSEPVGISLRRLVNFANLGMAEAVYRNLMRGVRSGLWPVEETVFYSYWCKYTALALAWMKRDFPHALTVARAHRGDLYEEEAPFRLVSRQADILSQLNRCYAISQDGASYLCERFPEFSERVHVARLGTPASGGRCRPSSDGVLRIVSCSSVTPVKRVKKIFFAALNLAAISGKSVDWTHFGDGPGLDKLKQLARTNSSKTHQVNLRGKTRLEMILHHYLTQPVDVFVNASRSEGIPVSMMEAMSCGIPCVGPQVGGIPELLSGDSGGELVESLPTPEMLAQGCWEIARDRADWIQRSDRSFARWNQFYNANVNFSAFAQSLTELK